nr:MAG TPA: hypothetical protein [Caudoviricetes sp.]
MNNYHCFYGHHDIVFLGIRKPCDVSGTTGLERKTGLRFSTHTSISRGVEGRLWK